MILTPRLTRFVLTAHIICSVGWLGAVVAFLVLAIAGVASHDAQMVRAAYLAMDMIGWLVIVPFALASLLTGLVQSVGTSWGLVRHYWILAKLFLTVPATALLFVHLQPTSRIARVAAEATLTAADLSGLRQRLVADAAAALVVLLVATTLSVYKPWGMTAYGRRQQADRLGIDLALTGGRRWAPYVVFAIAGLVLLIVIVHLAGGGLHHH